MTDGLVVGIDASRNRSGGARANLVGLLGEGDPRPLGVREVHVWAFQSLLEEIPERSWLVKHCPPALERSLARQLWWQASELAGELQAAGCRIVFTTDASTMCRFRPMVVMSQDMLSYEPGIRQNYGLTKSRLRAEAILHAQNRAFRFADGVIFHSEYASTMIQRSCGRLRRVAHIPPGIAAPFHEMRRERRVIEAAGAPIRCLYVSNTLPYKHQWVVVRAVAALRARGHDVTLTLVGGGTGRAQQKLDDQVAESDPGGQFVSQLGFISEDDKRALLGSASLFVFASSCENLPVTLLEAMAAGLPIACSSRGPMPEVLGDAGVYFDPEDADSIASAVEQLIVDVALRARVAEEAKARSRAYSWSRCAGDTWRFIVDTYALTEARG